MNRDFSEPNAVARGDVVLTDFTWTPFHWSLIYWSVSTIYHHSWIRKSVCMV